MFNNSSDSHQLSSAPAVGTVGHNLACLMKMEFADKKRICQAITVDTLQHGVAAENWAQHFTAGHVAW